VYLERILLEFATLLIGLEYVVSGIGVINVDVQIGRSPTPCHLDVGVDLPIE